MMIEVDTVSFLMETHDDKRKVEILLFVLTCHKILKNKLVSLQDVCSKRAS